MNAQTKRQAAPEEAGQLSISISGNREDVARLLAGLVGTLGGEQHAAAQPEHLLLTREQVMQRTGWGHNKITGLVQLGKLTNRGSARKLLISPRELEDLIASQG